MSTTLELEHMTLDEKLAAMDALWADLSRNPQNVPVPSWQKDLLDARERAVSEGRAQFLDWNVARQQIDDETRRDPIS